MRIRLLLTLMINIFLRFYLFLERGERKEKERERNMMWEKNSDRLPLTPPTGGLASNPGMCRHWESNQQPFGAQAGAQSAEPHQPGHTNDK